MNLKSMLKSFAVLTATTLLALGAQAKNYSTVWSQDFENTNTYTNEAVYGAVASTLLGTTAITPSALTNAWVVYNGSHSYSSSKSSTDHFVSWESRNNVRTGDSSHYLSSCMGKQDKGETVARLMLVLPEEATNVTDYIVEFDYNLSTSFSNNSNSQPNGLVVVGSSGNILATFATTTGGTSAGKNGYLFRGDSNASEDILASAIPTGIRGTRDTEGYWLHVTITGNQDDGVWISFTSENGKKTLASTQLTETFDTVSQFFIYHYAKQYVHYGVIDDIVVGEAEDSKTFTWTGAVGDSKWATPGNWKVAGAATEFYPTESDAAEVTIENQTIIVEPGQKFGTLTLESDTKFLVNFANSGETFDVPDGITAENVIAYKPFTMELSGTTYTATRVTSTFTWNVASGDWSNPSNWTIDGTPTFMTPLSTDSASFESAATVTLTEETTISSLTIADSVRVAFASDETGTLRNLQMLAYDCGASSTLALSFINLSPIASGEAGTTLTVGGYVEIVDNTTNGIYATSWRITSSNKPTSALELTGNLIGGGALTVGANASQSRGYVFFYGDNSAFTGVVLGTHYLSDGVQWCNENAGSASAIWNLSQTDSKALKITSPAGTTNKFGRLISNGVTIGNSNGAILEIGALGGESTLDLASGTFDVIKVGTGNLTLDGNQTGNVRIESGTVTMGSANATLFSVNRAFTFAGGSLVNAYGTDMSPYIANCAMTTSAIVINDCGVDAIWATALPAAAQGGFTKKGAGMLTLTEVPKYTGKTTVEGGLLRIPAGTVIDTLDVKNGATIDLYTMGSFTEATPVFTISNVVEGVDLATAIPNRATISYTFEQDTETGVWTVKAVRAPAVYTWTGAVDSTWENAGNWLVNGAAVLVAPTPVDMVLFPAKDEGNWNVTVAIDTHIVGMTNNAPVTLTGEGDIYLVSISSELEDAPALTLGDNATIRSENQREAVLAIDVPLNIAASAEYPAGVYGRWMKDSGGNSSLYINRELLGEGYVEMKQSRGGIYFNGNNTAFAGSIKIFDDSSLSGQTRTDPRFILPESTSSNAVWDICNNSSLLQDGGKTYYFGSLSGYITLNTTQSSYKLNTLEIGARDDVDSVLGGNFFANAYINLVDGRGNTIRKVGNSTLTTTATHVRAYELNGGLTVLNDNRAVHTRWNGEKTEVTEESEAAEHCYDIPISFGGGILALGDDVIVDPSTNIVNSTAPIAFSNATDRVWASPLAASNQRHKIVKKGEGTLTLSAAPDWDVLTVEVDAGSVVVPKGGFRYSCGQHTVVEVGEDTLTFTYGERVPEAFMLFLK